MIFRYFKFPLTQSHPLFGSAILKPIIPVELTRAGRTVKYAALVDSGADFCIFDAEIADILEIDVRSGVQFEFGGIQERGGAIAYMHSVELSVGGMPHKVTIGFSYDIAQHGYGVLGQKGFFDLFAIKFDLEKEEIELKPSLNQ